MSNETPAAIDRDMFAAVFSENWDNARYIKSERIFWGPMAYAIMGGLAVATLLTLIALPSLYITWFKIRPDGERTTSTGVPTQAPAPAAVS
jgi:hypothetical protein